MSDHRNPRWWEALNPPVYLVSILPGLGVWLLARTGGNESYVLAAATLAVVLLQHMINVLNDVSDPQSAVREATTLINEANGK